MSTTIPGAGLPNAASAASVPASAVWTLVVVRSSSRRGTRSASAPPIGPSKPFGANPAASTRPLHVALFVLVCTRIPTATVSIHVPMFDVNAPLHSSANGR